MPLLTHINEVVKASGYSLTLINALRRGGHPWNFAPLERPEDE